jgi:hypothetical protein
VPWLLDDRYVDSLEGLLRELEALALEGTTAGERWLYRGQARAGWPLEPSIERRFERECPADELGSGGDDLLIRNDHLRV